MKSDFMEARDKSGQFLYKTIEAFALDKFKYDPKRSKDTPAQWFLKCTGKREIEGYPWKGDWMVDRHISTDGRLSKQLELLRDKVSQELDIIEAGRLLAESYFPFQQKVHDVWMEIEAHFGGTIFVEPTETLSNDKKKRGIQVSEHERKNLRRLALYMKSLNWVLDTKTKIDTQIMHMLGLDRPQFLLAWQQIHEENKKKGMTGQEDTAVTSILVQLARDQIAKSKMFELPLPGDIEDVKDEVEKRNVK